MWRWRWRWRSPLSYLHTQSFMPLYLVAPLFFFILILLSSILRPPHASLFALTSSLWASFIHLTSLTVPANESSYLRSVQEEITVSFIILYSLLSMLPVPISKGNWAKNHRVFYHYYYYYPLWCFLIEASAVLRHNSL